MAAFRRLAASLVLVPAAFLAAGVVALAAPPTDSEIRDMVMSRLVGGYLPENGVIHISVRRGEVTLRGEVNSAWAKTHALDIAADVDGVAGVVDQLDVMWAPDSAIVRRIDEQLPRYVFYSIYDAIETSVHEGIVKVTGVVTDEYKVATIGDLLSRIDGVVGVTGEVGIASSAPPDVALRTEIAARIYQHPLFRGHSLLAYPAIHVLVEGGRVVLVGRVATAVERDTAEGIACSVEDILSVDNRLVVTKK